MFPFGLIVAIIVLASPAAAAVMWTFSETNCAVIGGGSCSPTIPFDLLDFTLPTSISSGSANMFLGFAFGGPVPPSQERMIFTGDSFTLDINDVIGGATGALSSTAPLVSSPASPIVGTQALLSWSTTASGISENFNIDFFIGSTESSVILSGTGGMIGSDLEIDNCPAAQNCQISGTWNSTPVNEPAGMLLTALAVLGLWAGKRRHHRDTGIHR